MASCAEPLAALSKERSSHDFEGTLGFHDLYDAHFDTVLRLILRFGIGRHDAEDLAQRVFLVVYRRHDDNTHLEHPEAWLRAIVVRVVRQHFRWLRVRRAGQWLVEHSWAGRAEDDFNPERDAIAYESLHRARRVLQRMSHKLRETVVLLDIEGLSPKDAAELLNIPINTLRSRRALAREEFKRLWDHQQLRKEVVDD